MTENSGVAKEKIQFECLTFLTHVDFNGIQTDCNNIIVNKQKKCIKKDINTYRNGYKN